MTKNGILLQQNETLHVIYVDRFGNVQMIGSTELTSLNLEKINFNFRI
jgi:hypothetical protein